MEPRLSFLSLGVADLDRARRFYEEGLGLPRRPSRSLVLFELGGPLLALVPRDRLAAEAGADPGDPGGGVALSHNVARPEAVEELLAAAVAAGGRLVRPARDTSWGGRAGWFADPDGHLWEVVFHPDFPTE